MPVEHLDGDHGVFERGVRDYLDIRIHTPIPAITVVRLTGELDILTVPLMVERVSELLLRAEHVVVDLGGVGFLGSSCLTALRDLDANAAGRGVTLHWTGAQHKAVIRPLELTGLDRKLRMYPVPAHTVVAQLRLEHLLTAVSHPEVKRGTAPGVRG